VPSYLDGVIIIARGDSVIVSDTAYADQLLVNAGGVLHVINNILYLKNGAGVDLRVDGKLIIDPIARVSDDPVTAGSSVDYRGRYASAGWGFQIDLTFHGSNPQTVLGNGYGANLTINNSAGVTLASSQSYNGANFINGKINGHRLFCNDTIAPRFYGRKQVTLY